MKIQVLGRLILALGLATSVGAGVSACGPKTKKVKKAKDDKPKGPTTDEVLAEARAASDAGDIDDANAKYIEAYAIDKRFDVLTERVQMLIDHRRVDAAVAVSLEYYEANPTDAKGSHLYANALIAAGSFNDALAVAEELVALDDNDAAAHEKRGRALILGGRVPEGVEELRRAVELEPNNAKFLVELGSGLLTFKQANEAALQLRAAIAIEPENARALMLLGMALADQVELQEAEVFLRQSVKLTKDARPWFELGLVQAKRGDSPAAAESLAQAVAMEPDNELYQYAYGEVLRFEKRYDEAIAAYTVAADHDPPHPKAASKLGLALAQSERHGEAEVYLTEAIRKDPTNPFNYFNLGSVYNETKKLPQALDMFRKFLEKADPEDGDRGRAQKCVEQLKKRGNKKPCVL